jgi:hypothetical protein
MPTREEMRNIRTWRYAKQRAELWENWKEDNGWKVLLFDKDSYETTYYTNGEEVKTFSELYDLFTKENPE